jgi:putative SOS response-associated peptidase YedK
MCARYELLTTLESIVAGVALRFPPTDEQAQHFHTFARGEVRPTNLAPIIMQSHTLAFMPWGLAVDWQSQPVINARAESLGSKPTFKPLLNQRCLVPASAYFEWRAAGKMKIKTRIRAGHAHVMMFAGLIGDGRFTIVTCAPAPIIAHIHDRMPMVLDRAAQELWLSDRAYNDVKSVLVPFGGDLAFEEFTPPPHRQGELAF